MGTLAHPTQGSSPPLPPWRATVRVQHAPSVLYLWPFGQSCGPVMDVVQPCSCTAYRLCISCCGLCSRNVYCCFVPRLYIL